MVDAAANLRKFVVLKRDGEMATEKMTLKLPGDAKQGIMDGLVQCLDKSTALATMVGEAEVDDTASVPAELGTALSQVGEMYMGMAKQYAPAAAAPPGDAPAPDAPAPPAAPEAEKAAQPGAPAPATAPTGEVAKALPPELHDGDSFKQLLNDGDSMKRLLQKAIAIGTYEASIAKAGRKIKGQRFETLRGLHDSLGKLLNELAFDQAEEGAAAAPAKKDAAPSAITKGIDDATTQAELTRVRKELTDTRAQLAAVNRAPATSNGGSADNADPEPVAKGKAVVWANDMAADIERRKKAAPAAPRGR